jgi:hypothetical protein
MFSSVELRNAWFAGFWEGEGYICNDRSNGNKIRLGLCQNDPTPLLLAQQVWGGHITKRVRKSPASEKICTGHEWRLSHPAALVFIEDITPYMIVPFKKQQLANALRISKEVCTSSYSCSFCDVSFKYGSNRRRHERTQHINTGSRFTCDVCSSTYKTRDSLTRHKHSTHKPDVSDSSRESQDTSLQESP